MANMDYDWDNLIPFEPLVSKSQQFPAAFILMALGSHYQPELLKSGIYADDDAMEL